ncbi:MAG: OmpA family protein [Candidatus Auribacterota bacterium]|nr:OmpA family protein [Candidatus Auribacterota bacterium]
MEEDTGAGWPPDWITTYADMSTLLMTFFIILSTMLALNIDITWVAGTEYIDITPEYLEETVEVDLTEDEKVLLKKIRELKQQQMRELAKISEMRKMAREIQQYIVDANLTSFVRVEVSKWKLKIVPVAPFLFNPGGATLSPSGKEFVKLISQLFLISPTSKVRISGHTDNVPIHTRRYPSNWELSCARATSVMRYLIDSCGIDPEILSSVGYGPYQPLVPNDTEEGRAKNRRVEIEVIQRPGVDLELPIVEEKTGGKEKGEENQGEEEESKQ